MRSPEEIQGTINLLVITTRGMRERIFDSPIHEVVDHLARIAANQTVIAYLEWVLEDKK